MLPPGHIAAGYLTAQALLWAAHPSLDPSQLNALAWWGLFFGFAPDLDTFAAFAKAKSFIFSGGKKDANHRKFYSHAPILWLIAGLAIYFFSASVYLKYIGLLLWLGSWSHFLLDTVQYGIMWLWPFSSKVYAFRDRERDYQIEKTGFFAYWIEFLRMYSRSISCALEIIIIVIAAYVFLTTH